MQRQAQPKNLACAPRLSPFVGGVAGDETIQRQCSMPSEAGLYIIGAVTHGNRIYHT